MQRLVRCGIFLFIFVLAVMILGPTMPAQGAAINTAVSGSSITVSGDDQPFIPISIQVSMNNHRVYLNQKNSNADGSFTFVVPVSVAGDYQIKVSSTDSSYSESTVAVKNIDGGQVTPDPVTNSQAEISVNGINRLLLAPTTVQWQGNASVLSLLQKAANANGLAVEVRSGGYVESIGGLKEFDYGPTSGWKYRLNNSVPGLGAGSCSVKDGDVIEWYYVTENDMPDNTIVADANLPSITEIQSALKNINLPTNTTVAQLKAGQATIVQNSGKMMSTETGRQLNQNLAGQQVSLSLNAKPEVRNLVEAELQEAALEVPAGAISKEKQLSVKELTSNIISAPAAISSVYEFGPGGSQFTKPVLVSIRVGLDNIAPENAVLAWYDTGSQQWIAVPSVIDAATGIVSGLVNHFTAFSVINTGKINTSNLFQPAMLSHVAGYVKNNTPLSDWGALGLIVAQQSGAEDYGKILADAIKDANGQVNKITDVERQVLLAGALGLNPAALTGIDLLRLIYNDTLTRQGTNGVAYGLLALDSCQADVPSSARWSRDKMIAWMLNEQHTDGSWALTRNIQGDVDITAMVLTSLTPYQQKPEVKAAIDKALVWLAKTQLNNGGFTSSNVESSESASQVIIALCSLNISPEDARFKKPGGSLATRWAEYQNPDGGFSHIFKEPSNLKASEQALLAMAAWQRYQQGQPILLSFSQVSCPFDDGALLSSWAKAAVENAYQKGILKGVQTKPLRFAPQTRVTRAELVTMLARMQSPAKTGETTDTFKDVEPDAWYRESVMQAAAAGWVCGTPDGKFEPDRGVTRQEMALILARAYPKMTGNTAPQFSDLGKAYPAAREAINTVAASGLMLGSNGRFDPDGMITREMVATILMRIKD